MDALAVAPPDTEALEFAALSWPEKARALVVTDAETFAQAGELLTGIKGLRKEIADSCDPVIRKAHEAHQAACAQKKKLEAPLVQAEAAIKRSIGTWHAEEDRRRREEQRRLAEIARKAEEDARVEEAAALEAAGEPELARHVIEAPPIVAAPILPPAPKADGVSVRTLYRAQVVDLRALCKAVAEGTAPVALVVANEKALNQMAVALREGFHVPGCRVVTETSVAAGRR